MGEIGPKIEVPKGTKLDADTYIERQGELEYKRLKKVPRQIINSLEEDQSKSTPIVRRGSTTRSIARAVIETDRQ